MESRGDKLKSPAGKLRFLVRFPSSHTHSHAYTHMHTLLARRFNLLVDPARHDELVCNSTTSTP